MVRLAGDYLTRVFEEPFESVPEQEKEPLVESRGKAEEDVLLLHHLPHMRKSKAKTAWLAS